ncbi:hypothetical protein [Qipengyuania qiaonensis]|uniref:EF-hand domain-containing protein n=1 Tax=Qipengyuania qiaonensis TaxID=2867240 RepID=A0ABS7JE00_9SPHN|nr:hypothetical protein [Qipengyuania qiaonensis]MBX7483913.1 hypothetical protein [Qipengyuania qiaonensis]
MSGLANVMAGGTVGDAFLLQGPAGDVSVQQGGGSLDQISAQVWSKPEVKALYDMQARAMGIDPASIARGSDADAEVMQAFNETLNRVDPQKGEASFIQEFRRSAETTASDIDRRDTARLNTMSAMGVLSGSLPAAAAKAPGASLAAEALPVTETFARITPKNSVAIAAGATGAAIGIAAGELAGPTRQDTDEKERIGTDSLDTDHDGIIECKEIGTWVDENRNGRSANANAYQDFISGVPGTDFHVVNPVTGPVKFDGCHDRPDGAMLVEAKADHGGWVLGGGVSKLEDTGIADQGERQKTAASTLGVRNEWHTQTLHDKMVIDNIFRNSEIATPVIHSPMPAHK